MSSIVSITIAALANAASQPTSNGTDPRINWVNVCDYSDPSGSKCCAPGMEGHQYLVVPENIGWTDHAVECRYSTFILNNLYFNQIINPRLFGGYLAVMKTREEQACIEHWVENTYKPAYQLFAVSKRNNHRCIAMLIGTEVDDQGHWMDCDEEKMWAICELGGF